MRSCVEWLREGTAKCLLSLTGSRLPCSLLTPFYKGGYRGWEYWLTPKWQNQAGTGFADPVSRSPASQPWASVFSPCREAIPSLSPVPHTKCKANLTSSQPDDSPVWKTWVWNFHLFWIFVLPNIKGSSKLPFYRPYVFLRSWFMENNNSKQDQYKVLEV